TPVSRARSAAYSWTPSQASAQAWIPWLNRLAYRGSTQEFTIGSTLRRGSRWDVGLQRLHLRQTSTRSPRARNKTRFTIDIAGSLATPEALRGSRCRLKNELRLHQMPDFRTSN